MHTYKILEYKKPLVQAQLSKAWQIRQKQLTKLKL